jgi:nitroimidazol reductase NimA-like FMN-containing flavoprotein (pyridoxamine 5'-phosphate oxidase superfamily)
MQLDRNGLEVLPREECLHLLGTSRVGRVVVTDRALPAAFPVNFALLDDDVVFLTTAGSKLDAADEEEVMAFEVDEIEPALRSGWSVLVQGLASVLTDHDDLVRAQALGLESWTPGGNRQFVRISSELVSGRRLLPRPSVTTVGSTSGAGDVAGDAV